MVWIISSVELFSFFSPIEVQGLAPFNLTSSEGIDQGTMTSACIGFKHLSFDSDQEKMKRGTTKMIL